MVALNALSKDLAGQVLLFRKLFGITAHSSVVSIPMLKGVSKANNSPQVASVRGTKV